ncbi:MAG TPA: NADH-quinone oxidoreductase subunit L [Mycobacteriales bacterium]|nr:NADH-quinone oxidoreductase subunit L [Mycobacteriales bacterium]
MSTQAWLLPALPFAVAILGLLFGRRLPGGPAPLAVTATLLSTVLAVPLVVGAVRAPTRVTETTHQLLSAGGVTVTAGTRVDGLSATVALMVCIVALLVQFYSIGYMKGDPRYSSYAAIVSLFTAAMLLVVLAADLLMLLIGWEVMGICSYLLIGHYWEHEYARSAAVKAFLTTRTGDVGFLFGIFTLGIGAGSFRISDVLAADLAHGTVVVGTLLLLCGVVGKSAQFPLHTWLPDAMAGPTPISALIHAATMVAAGIYLVARLFPVFTRSVVTLDVLAVIAAITMLGAALAALAQDDIKRVLAYSTVSQLAYMAGGLSVGGYGPGIFHLLTHAGFKALLFLAAGAVIHTVGTNLMSEMGGLRRGLPITFPTMTIGLAALAGLPPFSGFFSKESILGAAHEAATHGEGAAASSTFAWLVLVVGMATVFVTAAYVTRLWLRTFFGPSRSAAAVVEAPFTMTLPLVLLAVPSALLGFVGVDANWLPRWIGVEPLRAFAPEVGTSVVSVGLALLGILTMAVVWRRDPTGDPIARLAPAARRALDRAFYVDDAYDATVVRPTFAASRDVIGADVHAVDAVVNGSGVSAQVAGGVLRLAQNGNIQAYVTGMFVGLVAIVVSVAVLA